MKVNTLVQHAAEVVTIVTLRQGDVYKRLHKNWGDDYTTWVGVVLSTMSNGEDTVFTTLEFDGTSRVEYKTYGNSSEMTLFPCTLDEFVAISDRAMDAASNALGNAERELASKRRTFEEMLKVRDGLTELTEAPTHVAVES
jgi:hypothetical protein